MTNYTKFSKLALSAALALTTASSVSLAGKAPAKGQDTATKDGAAVSAKITLKTPSKESRKTASSDELKLKDKELRAALMKMRYCMVTAENGSNYKMTFHHNNVITLKFDESSSSYGGDSYGGDSYGGDSYGGDSYGGEPYGGEGAGKSAGKSSWRIKGGQVIVNLNGGSDQVLFLTKSGLAKHRCN